MIRATTIRLRRGEGPRDEIARDGRHTVLGPEVWREADEVLSRWSRTAPEPGGGYDKCDAEVTWEGGDTYTARVDLQRGVPVSLARHIIETQRFYAGLARPAHLTAERYAAFLAACTTAESRARGLDFISRYDIGGLNPEGAA